MDPLTQAIQQIMGVLGGTPASASSAGTPGILNQILPLLLMGLQTGGAIQYGGSQLDALSQIYNLQKQAARMALGVQPGQLGVQAARMAQPLNKQLAYQVTSGADAASALRGLTQAPGAMAAGEAAALAPYEQQNLQTGAQLATSADQLALSRLAPIFQMQAPDYTAALGGLSNVGENTALPPNYYGFPGIR